MIAAAANLEIGRSIIAGSITTNYHEQGEGPPVLLIHGSGPGVSAWANWRLNIGALAQRNRVIAPDLVGFGYTERPQGATYGKELWVAHMLDLMDALAIDQADMVGNSMGGGLAIAFALQHPERVRRLVLMGSVGISFPITPGLDAVWGYEPSIGAMRGLLDIFAHDRGLVSDELAELRYKASIKPGFQESFASMFPVPRQDGVDALATDELAIATLPHACLIIHGREDRVIPPDNARRLFDLIPDAELHMFGHCGHWTQIERVDRFNGLVAQFLHQ
ncbi:MAG: alpha/beta fold hydrolase [Burkholderiales bacterium]|nr:alpha/beta fold hydrolase [Phycisphaerae bacterium]